LWKKSSERGGFETPLPQINIKVGPGQNPGRADLVFVWVLLSYLKIRPSAKRERVGRAGEKQPSATDQRALELVPGRDGEGR